MLKNLDLLWKRIPKERRFPISSSCTGDDGEPLFWVHYNVEGIDSEVLWMMTVESVVVFICASLHVRNHFFLLPHEEGIFFDGAARGYTSLRNP